MSRPHRPASPDATREALKEAVAEALRENRDWIREVVQEALVDAANAEARREEDLRNAAAGPPRSPYASHGRA